MNQSDVRLIDIRAVQTIVGCRKTKLYAMVRAGAFPAPCRLGKSSRWPMHEVEAFVSRCIADRDSQQGATNGPGVTK